MTKALEEYKFRVVKVSLGYVPQVSMKTLYGRSPWYGMSNTRDTFRNYKDQLEFCTYPSEGEALSVVNTYKQELLDVAKLSES